MYCACQNVGDGDDNSPVFSSDKYIAASPKFQDFKNYSKEILIFPSQWKFEFIKRLKDKKMSTNERQTENSFFLPNESLI